MAHLPSGSLEFVRPLPALQAVTVPRWPVAVTSWSRLGVGFFGSGVAGEGTGCSVGSVATDAPDCLPGKNEQGDGDGGEHDGDDAAEQNVAQRGQDDRGDRGGEQPYQRRHDDRTGSGEWLGGCGERVMLLQVSRGVLLTCSPA